MPSPFNIGVVLVGATLGFALVSASPSVVAQSARGNDTRPGCLIRGGDFAPFYRGATGAANRVHVDAYRMDVTAVTNAQYLEFVRQNPRWQRSQIRPIYADSSYLRTWRTDLELDDARPNQPVTYVSWFAARAFCAAKGGHLPTESQWEFAARADEHRADAARDPRFVQRILRWYAAANGGALADVAQNSANYWGMHDMHGLIWEWVEDFNASMISSDDRQRGDPALERFCGGSAIGASDVADYAGFMRYAFRSSLRASYTVHNLGFRCAYDEGAVP